MTVADPRRAFGEISNDILALDRRRKELLQEVLASDLMECAVAVDGGARSSGRFEVLVDGMIGVDVIYLVKEDGSIFNAAISSESMTRDRFFAAAVNLFGVGYPRIIDAEMEKCRRIAENGPEEGR